MEKQVIMSMLEYTELNSAKEVLDKTIKEGAICLHTDVFICRANGVVGFTYKAVTKDEVIQNLNDKLSKLQEENRKIIADNFRLKHSEIKKKWWQI